MPVPIRRWFTPLHAVLLEPATPQPADESPWHTEPTAPDNDQKALNGHPPV